MSTSKKRPREAETQPDASRMMDRSAVLPRPLFPSTKINQHEGGRGPRHFSSSSSTPKSSPSVLLMSRENPYLSEGMRPSGQRKTHRKLQFNEPGRFASEAEADRKAAKLASLSRSIEQRLGDDQVLSDAILAMAREATPDVEWWDEPFVLGPIALEEPTRAEALVRRQIRERTAKHEQANAERALTDEQRRIKKIEYWRQLGGGTLSAGSPLVHIAAFQTPPLGSKERFKLIANGGQMQLHGLLLRLPDRGLIVVEGSLRAITHYRKLLTVRMKWQSGKPGEEETEVSARLFWQGTAAKPSFQRLAWVECASYGEARIMLKEAGFEHILKTAPEDAPEAAPAI
ncbi:U4/U6 small nuclear ribonucleoprotein Prp3 [Mitosporidium daphniae]